MLRRLAILAILLAAACLPQTAAHSVTIPITAPTSGGSFTSYNVYRSTTSGTYTGAAIGTATAAATSYVDSAGLVEGTTYFYVATAVGPGGESVHSNEVSAKIPFSLPNPPTLATPTVK